VCCFISSWVCSRRPLGIDITDSTSRVNGRILFSVTSVVAALLVSLTLTACGGGSESSSSDSTKSKRSIQADSQKRVEAILVDSS
jgi:hypothetical protein